jgi:vacuolar-type H+-ATPase subunit H
MQFLPDAAHPNEGDTVHAVATAVTHVAVALDELKDQLEIANRRVAEVTTAQITEAELGRLFVRAAEFADSAVAEAEEHARRLITDARMDAERILADARIEAESIIEEAHRSGLSAAAAEQVHATIDGFTRVNRELVKELEFLRDVLQPQLGAPASPPLPAPPPTGAGKAPAFASDPPPATTVVSTPRPLGDPPASYPDRT